VIVTLPVGFPPCREKKERFVKDWAAGLDWAYGWRFKVLRWLAANPS